MPSDLQTRAVLHLVNAQRSKHWAAMRFSDSKAAIEPIAEIRPEIRGHARARPRVECVPQPIVHRIVADDREAEESDDSARQPESNNLVSLSCLLPFY